MIPRGSQAAGLGLKRARRPAAGAAYPVGFGMRLINRILAAQKPYFDVAADADGLRISIGIPLRSP